MVQVFVIISPFAFLCLINNKTEWFFKVWIKTFLSLILEQILIEDLIKLKNYGNGYLNILINELQEICSVTGNYENFKFLYK